MDWFNFRWLRVSDVGGRLWVNVLPDKMENRWLEAYYRLRDLGMGVYITMNELADIGK